MSADSNSKTTQLDAGLREIDALVEATPPEEIPLPEPPEESPDVESVARDLGISVDEVREMMATRL